MNDFDALLYLETRIIKNEIQRVLRQRARAALWVVMLVVGAIYVLLLTHAHAVTQPAAGLGEPLNTFIFCTFLIFLGLGIWRSANGDVVAFTSMADARFLIGSHLRERNVILWLQIRRTLVRSGRFISVVLVYTLIFHRGGSYSGWVLSIIGGGMVITALGIPLLKLGRRCGPWIGKLLAWTCIACALIPALMIGLAYVAPTASPLLHAALQLGFGSIVARMLAGDCVPIVALYAVVVALGALVYRGSTDLYPELFRGSELSMSIAAARGTGAAPRIVELIARRANSSRIPNRVASLRDDDTYWQGAWSLLWKDLAPLRHSKQAVKNHMYIVVAAVVLGFGAGLVLHRAQVGAPVVFALGGSFAYMAMILIAIGSGMSLASDICKPMWWFSRDSLRSRLYVSMLVNSWRSIVFIGVGIVAFGAGVQNRTVALLALPVIALLILLLQSIGLALYAMFPALVDQRGPVALLRLFSMVAALAPPFVLLVVVATVTGGLAFAGMSAALIAVAETLLLVHFAATRIANSGVSIAQAEA